MGNEQNFHNIGSKIWYSEGGDKMTIQFYTMPSKFTAGITLKNPNEKEQFNMALHSCEQEQAVLTNREKLAQAVQLH